jgi:Domain of unknown function (DUF4169)
VNLVNLRRARKAKARAQADAQAAENRRRLGTPKSERMHEAATRELEHRRLDAHRRELSPDPDSRNGE